MEGRAIVEGPEARRIQRVLRLGPGARLTLFDGGGREAQAEIVRCGSTRVELRVACVESVNRESTLRIRLMQALPKGDRMEWIVQKTTELGVQEIGVLAVRRSVPQWEPRAAEGRMARWRRIALEASRQSGRTQVPELSGPWSLDGFCEEAAAHEGVKLLLWEAESRRGLSEALGPRRPAEVWLVVGPEGGFEASEVRAMERAGFVAVRLGPRILRTETAGPVAVAILQYLFGDLG